jgi:hypothetical protein
MAMLDARPKEAAELRAFSRLRLNAEVAWAAVLFTDIMRDVQRRGGGNPFDNTNTIYEGTSDDNALNDGVRRYRADPAAAAWLRGHYTPTGRISRPLVALHTTYDPLVPPWVTNAYALTTAQAGADSLFVQQYVHRATHCGFTADEIRRSFDALRAWKEAGRRPQPGVVGNVKPAETQ